MNMKKTLAGLVASIVAVSAMATLSASAVVDQKETKDEWDLMAIGGFKTTWATNYQTAPTAKDAVPSVENLLTFGAGAGIDLEKATISDVVLTATGLSSVANATNTIVQKVKLNDYRDTKNTTWGVKINNLTSFFAPAADVLDLTAFTGSVTYQLTYNVSDNKLQNTKDDAKAAKNVAATANDSLKMNLTTAMTTPTIPANPDVTTTTLFNGALTVAGGIASLDFPTYAKESSGGIKLGVNTATRLNDLTGIGNLESHMIDALAGTKGSTITFSFKPVDKDDVGGMLGAGGIWVADPSANSFQMNLNGNKNFTKAATLVKTSGSIVDVTFNWDDLIAANNYVGLPGILQNISIKASEECVVTKVAYNVPAKTFEDPSKGEGVTETTAAITDAPVASETVADTTAPATNPATGNAPIALAVLPIAIVAAIVIAKKRG